VNAIEVQGLSKSYKNSGFSLNNVSFTVPSGAITGFVGENGSGKTTTIGCILNTLIKDSGTIKVFGEEMTDAGTHLREDIGVVFDGNSFSEYLTAAKISSAMKHIYLRWDANLFKEYLSKFNLPLKENIKSFSRGMKMKLGIAVALSHHPRLLILDEATAGLDPVIRKDILDILLDFVGDEKHSVLLSSHITSDLERVADYIAFIHAGKIILSEKKDDLIYNYGIMRCTAAQFDEIAPEDILAFRKQDYQINVLIADRQAAYKQYKDIVIDNATIEEAMLLLIRGKRNEEKKPD